MGHEVRFPNKQIVSHWALFLMLIVYFLSSYCAVYSWIMKINWFFKIYCRVWPHFLYSVCISMLRGRGVVRKGFAAWHGDFIVTRSFREKFQFWVSMNPGSVWGFLLPCWQSGDASIKNFRENSVMPRGIHSVPAISSTTIRRRPAGRIHAIDTNRLANQQLRSANR